MKKFISILLCMTLLMGFTGLCAGAVTLSDGKNALMAQFPNGACSGGLDYTYFSPTKGENDDTKYPLFVWLHGANSGHDVREPLYAYDFSFWSSEEYQARFEGSGGAFLLLPRCDNGVDSWVSGMTGTLKRTIDDFIAQHADNIDMSRIYIAGYSSGGAMVYYEAFAYPGFFAAIIPIASIYSPTLPQLDTLKNTSVWFFASTLDPVPLAGVATVNTTFNYLASVTNRPDGVRMTTVEKAKRGNGENASIEHFIFDTVIYDMHMATGETFAETRTKDATGRSISFPTIDDGVISWLSVQKKGEPQQTESLWQKIINLFKQFFEAIARLFGTR